MGMTGGFSGTVDQWQVPAITQGVLDSCIVLLYDKDTFSDFVFRYAIIPPAWRRREFPGVMRR
jgi:hypothetical protein